MATSSHLKALLRKNFILWKRSKICSFLEILVPIIFGFAYAIFRKASPLQPEPLTTYYDNAYNFDAAFAQQMLYQIKNCSNNENGGMVALAPSGDSIITQLNTQLTTLGFQTMLFASNADIDSFVEGNNYGTPGYELCFGVVMEKNNVNNEYEYTLRFNVTRPNSEEDIPPTSGVQFWQDEIANENTINKYSTSGFLVLQNWVDNLILKAEVGGSPQINVQMASVNVPAYDQDSLASIIQGSGQSVVFLPMLLPYIRMVNGILREKEKRIKEGMKIMGLNNTAFYLSWVITYLCIFTVMSINVSAIYVGTFFKHSSYGYVFLFHWLSCLSVMSMGICITTFCNKAKVGNVVAFIIVFAFGWLAQMSDNQTSSSSVKFWTSIGQPTSVALCVDHLIYLEVQEVGLNSETVSQPMFNHYMWFHYFWMTFEIIFYVLLGMYLDQVLPSEYGVNKHPLFCLMRKKKEVRDIAHDLEYNIQSHEKDPANFEDVDPNLTAQDQRNDSIQVKGLKKIYPNGKLAVDGVSYNMYQGQIFALLGHNGAGKTSTINMITGLYPATAGTVKVFDMDIHENLDDVRQVLGVCPQHDVLFDDLTVKEHLELFSVFKGMDPSKTQGEILKIIDDLDLTDKKDYLAKNLSGGQKRKLSIAIAFIGGSKFILLDEPSSGMDTSARRRLWDMLKTYKHGKVVLLTTHYMDEADYLGDRIAIMGEGRIQCLGRPLFLKTRFGVGYSLTLVKNDIMDPSEPIIQYIKNVIPESQVTSNVSAEVSLQLPLETAPRFKKLFDGLDDQLEDLKVSSYGVSVTTLEEVFLNVSKILVPEQKKIERIEAEKHKSHDPLDDFDLLGNRIKDKWEIFKTQFWAVSVKRYNYFKRDKKGLLLELFVPVVMMIFGIALTKAAVILVPSPYVFNDQRYGTINDVWYASDVLGTSTAVSSTLLGGFDSYFSMTPDNTNSISTFASDIFNTQDSNRRFSYAFNTLNTGSNSYNYTTLVDTRYVDVTAFAMNKMNQAIIRMAANNPNIEITLVNNPFPLTQADGALADTINGFTYAFIFAIAMSFIPASIVTFIVKEREINAKHQQIVSGVGIWAYWLGNYFIDITKYMIPCLLCCMVAKVMDAQGLIEGDKYGALWVLFLLYGPAILGFTYITSYIFKDHGQAQMATFFGNFGIGFVISLVVVILRLIKSTNKYAKIVQWIFRPIPTFSLTYGFLNLANEDIYPLIEGYSGIKSAFNIDIAGGDILCLGLDAIFYFALLFLFENLKDQASIVKLLNKNIPYVPKEMDGDVEDEADRIRMAKKEDFSIKVDQIRKVYFLNKAQTKVAVDKVSFGIKNGECFALLGVNGAGKTTTFKMLTGEIPPTSGEIYIKGFRVPMEMSEARKYIGYCPQFDTLLENLTAREHLELYAAIKCIPKDMREPLIEKQLRDLNLKQFENIPAGTYSGGNKRKLSVAIALIGNPPIVFLDEPSNGMDPEARRFMWSVISRISTERKHSSIILTTHSMEEAEALSTKIGIQVDGNLMCLGSAQHIKNRYGGGFEIEIKMNVPTREQINEMIHSLDKKVNDLLAKSDVEAGLKKIGYFEKLNAQITEKGSGSAIYIDLEKGKKKIAVEILAEWIVTELNGFRVREFLDSQFQDLIPIEHFQTFYRYKIGSDISIGAVFGMFEEKKKELGIMQYSVKQSTLEQVFNSFANNALPVKTKEFISNSPKKSRSPKKNNETPNYNFAQASESKRNLISECDDPDSPSRFPLIESNLVSPDPKYKLRLVPLNGQQSQESENGNKEQSKIEVETKPTEVDPKLVEIQSNKPLSQEKIPNTEMEKVESLKSEGEDTMKDDLKIMEIDKNWYKD